MFLAFLSPKFDPALEDEMDDEGPSLPTKADEEFKPFIRRLPEFKFWYFYNLVKIGITQLERL